MKKNTGSLLILMMWMILFPYQKVSAVARAFFSPQRVTRPTTGLVLSQDVPESNISILRKHYSHRSHASHSSHQSHRSHYSSDFW